MSTNIDNIYCFRCRSKQEFHDPQSVVMKNGKNATSAKCTKCNGKVFRIEKTSVPVAA